MSGQLLAAASQMDKWTGYQCQKPIRSIRSLQVIPDSIYVASAGVGGVLERVGIE